MEPTALPAATTESPLIESSPDLPFIPRAWQWACAPAVFAVLTLLMFADLLFSGSKVISYVQNDLAMQFIPWRDFGFGELSRGHLALWNPHVYGGTPYFAGFQSALLYPPNWIHLILPVDLAINWIVAAHVFMLGYFVYFWCRGRSIGIAGSILAGVMFMFSGPYFLHLYAGHLPHLAVIVWAPLMLLALDKLASTGNIKWAIFGVGAASMQILAGHPQYVYYTGIIFTLYMLLNLILSKHRGALLGGFALMYFGAVMVTAIQFFSGVQAASEFVRSAGLKIETAGTFSLPPSNFLTLIAPQFFGDLPMSATVAPTVPYWGAGYLWELSLFISVSGVAMAALGAFRWRFHGPIPDDESAITAWVLAELQKKSQHIILLLMILVTALFAMGRYTIFYEWLYRNLPEYSSFRGTAKFGYLMTLFVSMFAAMGLDSLVKYRKVHFVVPTIVAAIALSFFIYGVSISVSGQNGAVGWWGDFLNETVQRSRRAQELFNAGLLNAATDPKFIQMTAAHAASSVYLGAVTLLVVAGIIAAARYHQHVPFAVLALAILEMVVFAFSTRATMDPSIGRQVPLAWQEALKRVAKDNRVATAPIETANVGMSAGFDNINGYDPGILKRYAELFYASQGMDRAEAGQYLIFQQPTDVSVRILRMLRCQFLFGPPNQGPLEFRSPLPVAFLVSDWMRSTNETDMLATMFSAGFDPAKRAITLSPTNVPMMPSPNPPGTSSVIATGTDFVEVQADLQQPGMLVITNNFSSGWRVVPLESPQHDFDIVPVNYSQMGLPLYPGKHHLRIEYSPLAFRVGRLISILSIIGFGIWTVLLMRRPAKLR